MMETLRKRDQAGPPFQVGGGEPLRCWTASQTRALANCFQAILQSWGADWGMRCSEQQVVTCQRIRSVPGAAFRFAFHREAAPCAWLHTPDEECSETAATLFGGEAPGPMAVEVAALCRADLMPRIASRMEWTLSEDFAAAPASLAGSWSGAVVLQWTAPVPGSLLVDGRAMEHWLVQDGPRAPRRAPAPGVVALADALRTRTIELGAMLDGCSLPVAVLQRLRVGDVLPLSHALDAPLRVTDAGGALRLDAYLGSREGIRAIELVDPQRPAAGDTP